VLAPPAEAFLISVSTDIAPVRRKCGNIDKPHHLGVGTRFRNHDAPIRMPDFNLSSCKRISRATRLLPAWLHDATTDRMPESGIMVQPDFLAISYESRGAMSENLMSCRPP